MAEIRPLTGLRGVAAVSVSLAHMHNTLQEFGFAIALPEWARRLLLNSGAQVDIFFVLSGFILAMNYGSWFEKQVPWPSFLRFLQRRVARIYPLHFVILLMVICLVLGAHLVGAATNHGLDRFKFSELPATFLLMQAWGVFFPGDGEWNPPSWSISIEALAYLLFPFLIYATAAVSTRRPWLMVLLAGLAGIGLNLTTQWGLSGYGAIARGGSEFVLGCFSYRLLQTDAARWLQSDLGSVAAVAALLASFLVFPDATVLPALFCVPVLIALCRENLGGWFFGWGPIYFLGEVSYSIYLGHFLFSSVAYRIVSLSWMHTGVWQMSMGILLIVGFVLIMSTFCYYAVERPGRKLLGGRRSAAVASAA